MKKKMLSIVLSLTMIVTMMPYGVFAAAEADGAASQDKTAADQTGQETGSGAEEAGNPADAETSQSGDAEMPDESAEQPEKADASGGPAETQTNDKSLSEPADPVKEPEQTDDSDVKADSRTEYVWKSDSTKVTAVLSDPEAVSDDAKLIVTPINKDSDGYSYKAYMEALNDSSEAEYTEENTKLYDIAFIKDGTEIHPSKGKVSVTFEFLDPQLSEAIGAKDDSDVSVIHLPVKGAEKYDTTAEASDLEAGDIYVEEIDAKANELTVSLKDSKACFVSADFSVYAFTTASDKGEAAEFAENGDTFTADKDAMKDTGKTWAEAQGKFSLKAKGAAKAPQRAAKNILEGYSEYEPKHLTSHQLIVDDKELKSGDMIDPAANFQLRLQFALTMRDMRDKGLKYYFELPDHISIGDLGSEDDQLTLFNSNNVAIGTYFIKDDVLYVTFPGYYSSVVANFSMNASWSDTAGRVEIEVPWKDKTDKYYIDRCDLMVSKKRTASYKRDENNQLYNDFRVVVEPKESGTNATIQDIKFTDKFSSGFSSIAPEFFTGPDGEKYAFRITFYDSAGAVTDTQYYKYEDICQPAGGSSKNYNIEVDGLTITEGGSFAFEYRSVITTEDNIRMDSKIGEGEDRFTNSARIEYPSENPETHETEYPFAETELKGSYKGTAEWLLKSAGDEKNITLQSETKTIIPYTVQINRHRYYSLGGSVVHDEITSFDGGDVRPDVVYDIDGVGGEPPYIEKTDSSGTSVIEQEWIVLDDSTYEELSQVLGRHDTTQLDVLRSNDALVRKLLDAIREQKGESFDSFTNEAAVKYIFTSEGKYNFIWFMPDYSDPATYLIHYNTIVSKDVGEFSNGAELWYTEFEGMPQGIGWSAPVKKVMNASKYNYGVYIGSDGNYYVDYKITVGVEAGSAGFEDIFLIDDLPVYTVKDDNGNDVVLTDWLCNLDTDSFTTRDNRSDRIRNNEAINNNVFRFSSDSDDPNVQKVVENAIVYEHGFTSQSVPIRTDIVEFLKNDPFPSRYLLSNTNKYKGEFLDAGQFIADATFNSPGWAVAHIKKGETYTLNRVGIVLGNLPGTEKGYDIEINYTMQINPYLVEHLPEILRERQEDLAKLNNKASVYTTKVIDTKTKHLSIYPTSGWASNIKDNLISSYWIGPPPDEDVIDKNVADGGYDKTNETLPYEVAINQDGNLTADTGTYIIEDALNISGMKYAPGTLTLTDEAGNIIFTDASDQSAAPQYSGAAAFTMSDNDNSSNSFRLTLDNSDGVFTDASGSLRKMTLTYSVSIAGFDTDLTIMNTTSLRLKGKSASGGNEYDRLIDEDTCEYSIDKAIDKKLTVAPTEENGSMASFEILVNPDSENAYELGQLTTGDTFTVTDEMVSQLAVLPETFKVMQILSGTESEITDQCKISLDTASNVLKAEVPYTEGAKYRIVYDAHLQGEANTLVRMKNTAKIEGTQVLPSSVDKKVRVYGHDADASASSYKIQLNKFDSLNLQKGLSAKFDIYKYENRQWVLVTTGEEGYEPVETDGSGTVVISNPVVSGQPVLLIEDNTWYKLVENQVQDGYLVDDTPVYYYASADGSGPETTISGVESYTVVTPMEDGSLNQPPVLNVSNTKLQFSVMKANIADGSPVSGAEFTLYRDADCTDKMDVQSSDEDGIVSFKNIDSDTGNLTLYLKETVTPEGFIGNSDNLYTLVFENGLIKEATDSSGNSLEVTKEGIESRLTVNNKSVNGWLKIGKTVAVTGSSFDKTRDTFVFAAKLTDKFGFEYGDDQQFPSYKVGPDGVEEPAGFYTSGSVFELKHGETLIIKGLPPETYYEVREAENSNYSVKVKVTDSAETDSTRILSANKASGSVEPGSIDDVQFTNTLLREIVVRKIAVTEDGEEMDIPDGLTISLQSTNVPGRPPIYAKAVWNARKGKFVLTEKYSSKIVFDDSIENGFDIKGLPADGYVYLFETNADTDTLKSELSYSTDNTTFITSNNISANWSASQVKEFYLKNTYSDDFVGTKLGTRKILQGRTLHKGDFYFILSDGGSNGSTYKDIEEAKNDENGNIEFSQLNFTSESIGDHYYRITEKRPQSYSGRVIDNVRYYYNGAGYYYSSTEIYVKVTVSLDEDGNLQVSEPVYSYSKTGDPVEDPTFVNLYRAEGSVILRAQKKVTKTSSARAYTLRYTEVESDYETPVKDANDQTITGTVPTPYISANSTSNVLSFSKINYTDSDVGKHYYLITEDIPDDAVDNVKDGIRYDDTKYRAEVDVSDNGNGTLTADLKYMDGSGAELEEGAVPLFDNKYVASGSITFAGKKTMENASFEEGDFTFLIEEFTDSGRTTPVTDENGDPVTYSAEAGASSYDSATGKYTADISYPEISYNYEDLGTHYYKVTEVVPAGAEGGAAVDGIKYDTRSYNINVTVNDAGNGKLRITTTGTPNALNFTNTYKATGTAEFNGTKTLEGKELTKDQFSFTADITKKKTDGTGSETTVATAKPFGTNSADGKISFPAQNYTEADIGYTYTYKIKEVVPADTKGVIYSDQEYTVSVKVEEGSKGVLELTTAYLDKDGETAESADFTNTYEASGSAKLVGVKHIENRTFREGDEWTFTISGKKAAADGEEAAPAPLPTDENGNEVTEVTVKPTSGSDVSFEFENISYTLDDVGTWIYTITESGDVEGVQNDTRTHTVTVTVEDKNTGTLDITVDYGKDAEGNALTAADFTNTYDAEGSIAVSGTKSITGREFREGDRWAFAITAGTEGAPMPVDSENKTVSYITIEPASGSQCNYEFGNIKFKLSDLKGEDSKVFRYTIRESGEVPGVNNDPDSDRTFEVEVTDLKNGSLDVKLTENSEDIAFTNDYRATGDITFGGKKSIDCRDLNVSGDHDVFEFTITGSDGTNKTVRNGADGTIAYPKIEYVLDKDHLDVIGDHTYRIAEKTVSQDGITKDSREYVVVIGVQDNGEGTLNIITKSVTAENAGEGASADPTENTLDFVNEYKAEGGFTFEGVKSIDVRELKEGETYRFTIQETGLLGIAKGDPITAESDDTGKIDYPELKYYLDKERDDTGTHTYKVTEEAVNADGITSSSKQYTVKLNVTDQENGELDVQVADGSDDPAKLDFENAYAATGEITLQGRKTIDCRDLNVNGDHDVFEFTITGEDGYSETVKNDADGNIEYPVLKYVLDKDHPDALGDYTYTIEEKTTSQSGITKDSEKYTIVINVADNKDGTLAVTAKSVTAANGGGTDAAPADDAGADAAPADDSGDNTAPAGDAIELTESNLNFVNEYRAEGSFTFKGTKSIDTRDLLSGERYSFTIQEYDENGEKVGDPLTAYSDDSGTINYPEISYELNKDRNDLGVHTYRVSEDASEAGGITTSSEVYTVKIKVTDLEDGTLEAVAAEDSEDPEKLDFENHYEAYGNASFKVTKQLDGRKWENKDSFRIELKAVGGAPMPEGTEAGSNVKVVNITKSSSFLGESFTETFGDIDFSKEDMKTNGKYVGEKTFEYKVREIKGNDRNIEYDKNVYTVKVTVFDNNNGSLITSTEFFNGSKKLNSLKFVNTYKADRKGVKTGDDNNLGLWLTLMLLTAGCLAGMLVYRRRKA